jgi:hypothetical protein
VSLRWSLASQQIVAGGCIHRAFHRLSRPVCRFNGGCSCRASAFFCGLAGLFPSSRYITGNLCIAISLPFRVAFKVNDLHSAATVNRFDSRNTEQSNFKKQ